MVLLSEGLTKRLLAQLLRQLQSELEGQKWAQGQHSGGALWKASSGQVAGSEQPALESRPKADQGVPLWVFCWGAVEQARGA